jgi:HAD superfamily hydrolase (TIGR01509 family)
MKRPLRAVIFDYGNTLVGVDPALHSKRTDYADVVAVPATERLARHLEERGLISRNEGVRFMGLFLAIRERNRVRAEASGDEIPATVSLGDAFRELGRPEPDPATVVEALRHFFSVEEEALQELPGAAATLRHLEERGLAIALLSNATDGPYIVRVVERLGWGRYFRPLVVSSDIGVRKPRAEAFQAVLSGWPYAPEEIAMVGDSLRHDVGGAQALGLRTFHLTWIPNPADPQYLGRIRPDASAKSHADLARALILAAAPDD